MPPPKDPRTSPGAPNAAPSAPIAADICIIGAGSGGLSLAAAAVAFGQKVVLIEKHKMGGDCLNYGCVPSKALIAAGRRAEAMRTAAPFGIVPVEPTVDPQAVHTHVQGVIAAIAPNDSVERFTALGVRVIQATARFVDKQTVAAGEHLITARRFVVATGSSPVFPTIPGLDSTPYFTNETIFEHADRIHHLIVIGGGSIGVELAQAHRRLGARVTLIEADKVLCREDRELAEVVARRLINEGISIREGATVERVEGKLGRVRVQLAAAPNAAGDMEAEAIEGTHLLVAVGRRPNVDDLGLEQARIRFDKDGIKVNAGLRTSNRRVYAIGDVAGGPKFTHVANHHAGIVLRRVLFGLPARVDLGVLPRVTYCDPELAWVGPSEEEARKAAGAINVLRWPFSDNDRAHAERATDGHVKVITDKKGRILAAGIVGQGAGELIQAWSLAVSQQLPIKAMTDVVLPYPTFGEAGKRAAYRYFVTAPANPLLRKVIGWVQKLG